MRWDMGGHQADSIVLCSIIFSPHACSTLCVLRLITLDTLGLAQGPPGFTGFAYPPLIAVVEDTRFADPSLRNIAITSVHTPASRPDDVRRELNLLLRHLPSYAASLLRMPYTDKGAADQRANHNKAATYILAGDLNLNLSSPQEVEPDLGRSGALRSNGLCVGGLSVSTSEGLVKSSTATWRIVYGAGAAAVTSSGGNCYDQFLMNPDPEQKGRLRAIQEPIHLAASKNKRNGVSGLSDHDPVVLELRESRVYVGIGAVGNRAV